MSAPTKGPMQQPETWSAIASGYAGASKLFRAFDDAALGQLGELAGLRLLEVAAGPGGLSRRAARAGASVVAVDFSDGMIAELQRLARLDGLEAAIDARVGDAQALPLDAGSFHAALCLFGFMFFPDRARAFAELHRVLLPNGRAVVFTWGPIERRPLMKLAFEAFAEAMPEATPPQKGELQQPAECIAELSAAGFVDVQSQPIVGELSFDSPEHYAEVIEQTSGPLTLMRRRMGEAAWAQVRERFQHALLRRTSARGPFTLGAEALMTTGTKPA